MNRIDPGRVFSDRKEDTEVNEMEDVQAGCEDGQDADTVESSSDVDMLRVVRDRLIEMV